MLIRDVDFTVCMLSVAPREGLETGCRVTFHRFEPFMQTTVVAFSRIKFALDHGSRNPVCLGALHDFVVRQTRRPHDMLNLHRTLNLRHSRVWHGSKGAIDIFLTLFCRVESYASAFDGAIVVIIVLFQSTVQLVIKWRNNSRIRLE